MAKDDNAKNNKGMELRDSLYLTDDPKESTFKYDHQLPSLPVPELRPSVAKLLDTIRPTVVGPKEELAFKETEAKARRFLEDPQVKELQKSLEARARDHKNWLESWWLEFAYLRSRKPLLPYSNMSAPLPIMPYWPVVKPHEASFETVRRQRAALSTYFQVSFWRMLRQEQMRPMIHKGVPWSMNQFRYLFNTVRRPGDQKDELQSWFRTASEGRPESSEIIVLHRGHLFAINPVILDEDRVCLLTAPQIERQLAQIEEWCSVRPYGPGVGALTSLGRSEWAEARDKLKKATLDGHNARLLDRIERALSVLVLDEAAPTDENEILELSMCGDPRNRWADKSITTIAFQNGTFGASADHTPYDGFCTAIMTHYLMSSVEGCDGRWSEGLAQDDSVSRLEDHRLPRAELLEFKLNGELERLVAEARAQFKTLAASIDTLHRCFQHFGKAILKEHRFHPEAFVQCAIHSAYYRQHNRMAPAYVTASTRRFHNGRTETCRSCYPEMLHFVRFLRDHRASPSHSRQGYDLLKVAVEKFQRLMEEASQARGCDRHLMGLYLTALLEGRPLPELFEDELVQRTNNYILSTSCGGYWNVCGGVPPLVEEGYGCFYGIEDQAITFCCTAYKSQKTNLRLFYQNLSDSLLDMHRLLVNRPKL